MRFFYYALFFAVVASCFGCSSGKQAFERGDYYDAVLKSINRLRRNPDHRKSMEALKQSYPLAVEWLEGDAKNQIASNSAFKWKNAVRAYEKINHLYDEINRSPGAKRVISNPKNYYSKLVEIKEKAAEESYSAGINSMIKDTRDDAKAAYYHFLDVNEFQPGYREVNDMLSESKFKATLKVVVDQIPVPTRYQLSGNFFQDQVESYLYNQLRKYEFVKFYTPEEAAGLEQVDQHLRIQFDDFTVGQTHTVQKEETVTRDSVKIGEVELPNGAKVPAYNSVSAKLTTFKKEVISKGLLSMIVVDGAGDNVLIHRKFNGQYKWVAEWGSFNGDERALSDAQLAICKKKESSPPAPQNLFIEFTKPIYSQLTGSLQSFYRKY